MSATEDLYQETLLDHKRHPRNWGRLGGLCCTSHGSNPLCGDELTLDLVAKDGVIENVAFEARGCAICVGSASLMTEAVKGLSIAQARESHRLALAWFSGAESPHEPPRHLRKVAVLQSVKAYPSRIKCAALAWRALAQCVENAASAGAADANPT